MKLFSRILLTLSFLVLVHAAFSQAKRKVEDLSDEEISTFFERAQSSGMTEAQLEKAAKAQGYTSADIAKMRSRLTQIGDTKTKEKTTTSKSKTSSKRTVSGKLSTKKGAKKGVNSDEEDTEDVSMEEEEMVDSTLLPKKKIYGANLFNNKKLNFEPDLRIATPVNYTLGPDDELNIDIFGEVMDNYTVTVSPEGTVKILNLSPIYVNGLNVEAASARIVSRLRQLYQGLNRPGSGSSAIITLGNVRSIKVTLVGEVENPGSYTISSLATVFNALYLAGGPNENGSYRSIRVIRNNKVVRTLDLYDFLLKADQKDNIQLKDQDIIRVGDFDSHVELAGEVRRPMVFEAVKGETLKDILRYAGGFTDKAYTYSLNVRRNTSRELKLLNITQDEVATFQPQNGDSISVGKIIERYENRVTVSGAVFRPGVFAIENGLTTVKELIKRAEGPRENAFLNRAAISRRKENYDPEMISFDLGKVLRGELADIALHREDSLMVYSLDSLREFQRISIFGEVNKPGIFEFRAGMKVADLILMAKGFKEAASYAKIELSRRVITHGVTDNMNQKIEVKTFDIDGSLNISNEGSQFELKPFDIISIRRSPNYEVQRGVSIEGMVNYPGRYAIKTDDQKISDLVFAAGGLKPEGFLDGAILYRDSTVVGVKLSEVLRNPNSTNNLLLMENDRLVIPRILETVKLTGGVQNPISIAFQAGNSLQDYLDGAGGYTEYADKKNVYVKAPNGISTKRRRFLFIRKNPKVYPGSEIVVPEFPTNMKKGMTTAEAVGLSSALVSVALTLTTLINNLTK
ncbi:SLBB domain-containing protein [Aquirufa antheringensis]|uniref:SLBB domain-containing protein n=1 Tax=Aquirufa antheringensis TaxID=2516559 RepID=UPI0022A8E32B|nr:SLBB domain-containing protein [Aquirufa antheringensis]MCZ2490073.1 sugar transporter [Aquirufa antheringensis]